MILADGRRLPGPGLALGDGHQVTLGVRPEHLAIGDEGVPAEVVVVQPTGAVDTQVYCKVADADVTVVSRERHSFQPGDLIHLQPLTCKTYLSSIARPERGLRSGPRP